MNTKEAAIVEGNRLIAEFMGKSFNSGHINDYKGYPLSSYVISKIKYHLDWRLLMPVVINIETLDDNNFSFFIVQGDCDIAFSNDDYEGAPNFAQKAGDKIKSTWLAVIQFINWYNNNKK